MADPAGAAGEPGYFCESNQSGTLGLPVFFRKAPKGALREIFFFSENFPKGRYTYFSLVRKVPKETFFLLLFAACKK